MPTYEYECKACGLRFERRHSIVDEPITECPECHGKVEQVISGGAGFILRGSTNVQIDHQRKECSLERTGTTCCGRDERCGKPPCGSE